MEPAISPDDCVLAVALPLTAERFLSDATAPDRDFARSVIAASGRPPAVAWSELYAPKVVAVCERIATRTFSLGAAVAANVTARGLRRLLERFPLASLVAHSVSLPIRPDDECATPNARPAKPAGSAPATAEVRAFGVAADPAGHR